MKNYVILVLGLLLPAPAAAQSESVDSRWLQLFDGETTFGWQTDGFIRVKNKALHIGDLRSISKAATTTQFGDWELHFEFYAAKDWPNRPALHIGKKPFKLPSIIKKGWHQAKLKLENGALTGTVMSTDPKQSRLAVDTAGFPKRGAIAFATPPGVRFSVQNVKLKPRGMKSIFNGKDLTGWKIFPGRKSKFTVKDGVLNIKNGNGDIQTTGSYQDFILQLDCISHGDNLNSGVFFRCLPDQYQQGYEAQIRNQFTDKPKQEYSLQIYDPKTHKLVDTIKKKYTAVDYGTGGIYRRQPARKEVAKDKEWFTMTVIAHGKHITTWVNGIQVTDWMDYRPLADNARKGCYLKGGPISLQGHDPTTNLSFRNFYVVELPEE